MSFVDDTPDVISIDLPIGFIYFDGGKLRQFNLGFHSMIREKIMNGALLVFDDTYGAEPGHHNRWGQIMTVDELVNTGEYRPVFIPPHAKSKTRLLRGANSSEIPHHIEVRFQSLEKHAGPIDESMRLGKTSTVVKVKGWETADLSEPSADQVRLDVMSSKGKVRVSSWVKLCVVSKPAPIEILTPRQILQHERNVNVVSGKKDIQRERERERDPTRKPSSTPPCGGHKRFHLIKSYNKHSKTSQQASQPARLASQGQSSHKPRNKPGPVKPGQAITATGWQGQPTGVGNRASV